MKVVFLVFILKLALAADGKDVVVEPDIQIIFSYARQFNLQSDGVIIFKNIYRRDKVC